MIYSSEKEYENFGKCLFITNGNIQIVITLDIGPRIIHYSTLNGKNVFFCDINRETKKTPEELKTYFGESNSWFLYGGHRLWLAPEKLPDTYYPDNNSVSYTISENTVTITQQKQNKTNILCSLVITISDYSSVSIEHRITNLSDKIIDGSAWALSVMREKGITVLKWDNENTELLPNRNLIFWPYSNPSDKRLFLGKKYICIKQDSTLADNLKIGINNTCGKIIYINDDNTAFIKKYDVFHKGNTYPDFNSSCEIYTCKYFMELESLSPLRSVEPNSTISHTEHWNIVENLIFDKNYSENTEKQLDNFFDII